MKQHEAVIKALENHNGVATLGTLYHDVPKISECKWGTRTPQASIRRIVQTYKEIYKIKPGLYGLVSMRRSIEDRGILQQTASNTNSSLVQQSNHTYYQGLLLAIGTCRQMSCWIPNQDRNKRFLDKTLGEMRTMGQLPPFSYGQLVRRSATVDVIWFNQRQMPASLFEVEYSTDIQNSLLKFNDLQDFNAQMVIVADSSRKAEYGAKLNYAAFHDITKRVKFLDFVGLVRQYEFVMLQSTAEVTL